MAEHGDYSHNGQTHNGQAPFRRYSPPAQSQQDTGRVTPFPRASRGSAATPRPNRPSPGQPPRSPQPRPSRASRRRWRRWLPTNRLEDSRLQAPAGSAPNPAPPAANREPGTVPQRPQPPAQPSPPPTGTVPKGSPAAGPRPAAPGSPPPARPASPRDSGHRGSPASALPPNPPASKVTPLRRRPVWSTPPEPPRSPRASVRDRKPRRRTARTPRPVLYGIRLLIMGIGMAAIAGTLLSVLNPENQIEESEASPIQASSSPPASTAERRQRQRVTAPLSLNQELTHLEAELAELETMTPGLEQAVFMVDLDSGNYVDLNGTESIAAASTIKVPILVAFLSAVDAGTVNLADGIPLREDLVAGGSGNMQLDSLGTRYTALEVATQMIINSDNTATNLMIDFLGGAQVLNQQFRDWGLDSTVIRNPLPDLEGTNTTSPQDLVRLLALVNQGELLSLRSRDRLLSIMERTRNRSLVPDGLADEEARVFNKTGDIGSVLGDVALIDAPNGKRYALAILVNRPHNDGRAGELIRRAASVVHQEIAQPVAPVGGALAPDTETSPAPRVDDDVAPSETAPPLEELAPGEIPQTPPG